MKKVIYISLLLGSSLLRAQSLDQIKELADEYYTSGNFVEAVDYYELIYEADTKPENQLRLALSLYHSIQYEKSRAQLESLLEKDYLTEESLYFYGQLLKTEGAYKSADSVFTVLLGMPFVTPKYESLATFQKEGCRLGVRMLKVKNDYQLKELTPVNSSAHDFGLVEGANGLLALASNRKTRQKQYYDGQYGGLLPNLIAYQKTGDNYEQVQVLKGLNTTWAEGTGCFSSDGRTLYFSSCAKNENCKIYVASLNEAGAWSTPVLLGDNINKVGFESKHPNISQTGDTLFFASNRPNGEGGLDIWMSLNLRANQWSPAINLGATVNTRGDEMSPYYSSQFNALLFSSNGHAGYGGYDIYMAKGQSFFSPKIYNIGPPFNSSFDDNYFGLGSDGYLSSNRNGRDFDIYQFLFDDEVALLKSFMSDDALVELFQHEILALDLHTFRLEEFEGYHIFQPVKREEEVKTLMADFKMIAGDAASGSVIRAALSDTLEMLTIASQQNDFEVKMIDGSHQVSQVLADKSVIDFEVSPMGFNGYEHEFEKIYFDFDNADLREESEETLRDLVRSYRHENIALVDVHTHTDHYGNEEYNFRLSEERGLNIIRFLAREGLDFDQLRVFPNGEQKLLSEQDTWYSRLINRRAEITVYTYSQTLIPQPEIFIVRKDVSLDQVSSILGISTEKLVEWNGLSPETKIFKEGHVLRVFDPQHLVSNYQYLIPEEDAGKSMIAYKVKPGDTIGSIAKKYGLLEEYLAETNHVFDYPQPGTELIIIMP